MINLIKEFIKLNSLNGKENSRMKNILLGNDEQVKVVDVSNSYILLSDNTFFKCVGDYYTKDKKSIPKKNVVNNCYYVQKFLGIQNINNFDCIQCHLHCLNNKQKLRLEKKYQRRRKK